MNIAGYKNIVANRPNAILFSVETDSEVSVVKFGRKRRRHGAPGQLTSEGFWVSWEQAHQEACSDVDRGVNDERQEEEGQSEERRACVDEKMKQGGEPVWQTNGFGGVHRRGQGARP